MDRFVCSVLFDTSCGREWELILLGKGGAGKESGEARHEGCSSEYHL